MLALKIIYIQVMEVTLSAEDGSLGSVQVYTSSTNPHQQQPNGGSTASASTSEAGYLTQADVIELVAIADDLQAPANLRLLVREAFSRSECSKLRVEHVRQMRPRYLVGYRAGPREVTMTMPAGIVALFRLRSDYPRVRFSRTDGSVFMGRWGDGYSIFAQGYMPSVWG